MLVPENESGASSDTEHTVTFSSEEEAKRMFSVAKQRLLMVSDWQSISGKGSAVFTLTDELGSEVVRPAQLGDHFRIEIPAPGNITGKGYDWVQVEAIEDKSSDIEGTDIISIRVRPVDNPTEPREDVAHFFSNEASSTFTVRRDRNIVSASVHGRNEKPNTEPSNIIDKVRNTVVAAGAMIGLNKPQWKGLVEGLLEDKRY